MIVGIRHKGLAKLYDDDDRSKLSPDMVGRIRIILAALDEATSLAALERPSFRLHALKGNRSGQHAITVRANWRIVFRFVDGDAHDVDLVDYH